MRLPFLRTLLFVAAGLGLGVAVWRALASGKEDLPVVPAVDLERYSGTWYEIARLPNRFQRRCAGDVTATYTPREDGDITVKNECRREDGARETVTGRAWQPEPPRGRLAVRFFWPFTGDYYIIGLDPDYRWALVGEPGRENLWVLAREPRMEEEQLGRILETARRHGYELYELIRTEQSTPARR